MNQEEAMLARRFKDLANASYQRNVPVFSDFLNLNEQNIFEQTLHDMPPVKCTMMGGYNLAERKIAAFLPYDVEDDDIPIKVIRIYPINRKFAEELNHRDYLGALLNLGIDRCVIGDILINDDGAYIFCRERMAGFIIEQLVKVRHTAVMAEYSEIPQDYAIKTENVTGTVSSVRLDSVLSVAAGISRNHIISYIEGARVFINGRLITTNSYALKDGDIISVRQVGRFKFCGVSNQTKKGRYFISVEKFI